MHPLPPGSKWPLLLSYKWLDQYYNTNLLSTALYGLLSKPDIWALCNNNYATEALSYSCMVTITIRVTCSYDDLVVGAPMNTDYDTLSVERGSIYVFFNDGVSIDTTL